MTQYDSEAINFVLRNVRDNDVKFIRLWFSDIVGNLKGVAITSEELESAMTRGMGVDGSSIDGFARSKENDMFIVPDPTTFAILPWRPKTNAVARMFCEILTPDNQPYEGDSRALLRSNIAKASDLGYTYYVAPELEYFYMKDSKNAEPLDTGGYFDQDPQDIATDLRRETVLTLEELGIPVESSHHEVSPGQHEIDLRHTDALTMADIVTTYRIVVKEIAIKHGYYATFMPKPLIGYNGSGMHIHQSLFLGDKNAFFDETDDLHISETAKWFIAGLLKHAREISLITNQWVNSYKRLVPSNENRPLGYEAPIYTSWATVNRSDLIRVPAYKKGRETSQRIEYRAPDPSCNPYLAFSVMLAAGLEGIKYQYKLPKQSEHDVNLIDEKERNKLGIKSLPKTLGEAIEEAENSKLVKEALGDYIFNSFLENKKIEWQKYNEQVTDYELDRYLPIL